MNSFDIKAGRLRILVAVCSHGEKNLEYLRRIVRTYQSMPADVRVVVLSEAPKNVCDGVEVVVGLPSKNPWSLPFAHKAIFAREVENYDLFIYSEDDILFSRRNLEAFLRVSPCLADDEITGFLHYEQDKAGKVWMVCVHRHFHWRAESVRKRGECLVAEFTNEHSALYVLTQGQLKRAIASGGFLREPYEGNYDMLCTAATDPYTSCGFRKVICISALEDFLVHHLPDKYVKELDVSLDAFEEQIQTLMQIGQGLHPARSLFNIEPKFWHFWWQKSYYEKPCDELLKMVPVDARNILSIGCGWGRTEAGLQARGAEVTALSLDSVIGTVAARRGIHVIHGTWDECVGILGERRFDCVLATNLVHLQRSPGVFVAQCSRFVREGGTLVLAGPNFERLPWMIKRVAGIGDFKNLRSFDRGGISVSGPRTLAGPIRDAGLQVTDVQWWNQELSGVLPRGGRMRLGKLTAQDWALQARRSPSV